ncbi:MAG: tyrosine-type recombinase/integrase [Acidimicrobiales bacterium]
MSALEERLAGYLALRRALGYRLVQHGHQLERFVTFLDDRGAETVTVAAALAWASSEASIGQTARRLSMVRRFAAYLAAFDERTEIPPADLLRPGRARTTPYLYTPEETAALIASARRLRPPLRGATMATAIGLMAATGLRTGEVAALDRDDVDLAGAQITVRDSKWHKSRQVPIHATTARALGRYARLRDRTITAPTDAAFLVTMTGRRATTAELTRRFRPLITALGIQAPPFRRPPRLYDFRHSFAVATLIDWYAAGVDVQARLPVLSTYMGHLNPSSTYWYLQAAPELLGAAAERLDDTTGGTR